MAEAIIDGTNIDTNATSRRMRKFCLPQIIWKRRRLLQLETIKTGQHAEYQHHKYNTK